MGEKLYVVMPAYNEEQNIKSVVCEWHDVLKYGNDESRIVVADEGFKDTAYDILISFQRELKQLIILNMENQCHGPKLIAI